MGSGLTLGGSGLMVACPTGRTGKGAAVVLGADTVGASAAATLGAGVGTGANIGVVAGFVGTTGGATDALIGGWAMIGFSTTASGVLPGVGQTHRPTTRPLSATAAVTPNQSRWRAPGAA